MPCGNFIRRCEHGGTCLVARTTSADYKAVLTGEGADEAFGGYLWFWSQKELGPLARLPLPLRRLMLMGPLLPRLFPRASRIHVAPGHMGLERYRQLTFPSRVAGPEPPFSGELRRQIDSNGSPDGASSLPEDFQQWHSFSQLQFFELTERMPNFIVHMLDHNSMASSLEARVPFLDHELLEFCAAIPPKLKMKRRREKHILREATKHILPAEIVNRQKRGLRAPIREWLAGPLPDFAAEMLSEESVGDKGYLDPALVSDILNRHRRGEEGCGRPLMACLVVHWDDVFLPERTIEGAV